MAFNADRERFRDEVRHANPVLPLVQEYCTVKKAGAAWKACCPFPGHDEKTPSFHIYEADGRVWCFGCKRGGDLFQFIMEMEGFEFVDALRHLADRAGLKMPEMPRRRNDGDTTSSSREPGDDGEYTSEPTSFLPRDIHGVLQFAVEWYRRSSRASGVHARAYLAELS